MPTAEKLMKRSFVPSLWKQLNGNVARVEINLQGVRQLVMEMIQLNLKNNEGIEQTKIDSFAHGYA